MAEKVRFPDGREVDIHDFIAFMYGLSKSDVEVLHVLLQNGKMTTDDLAEKLNVTKASISKALNNLLDKGLIQREKAQAEKEERKGRPNYIYWVEKEKLYRKLENDLEKLAGTVKETLQKHTALEVVI
ncbi:helix-turn-helix domain-containing protein [Sulfolobus tengchongensis]|uniref:Helix-turn-helix domain-containing protein n=1 Tax=Sulfolobus tengchongensis TaxID=207809 RepID=A0AAX4L1E1_9CREN